MPDKDLSIPFFCKKKTFLGRVAKSPNLLEHLLDGVDSDDRDAISRSNFVSQIAANSSVLHFILQNISSLPITIELQMSGHLSMGDVFGVLLQFECLVVDTDALVGHNVVRIDRTTLQLALLRTEIDFRKKILKTKKRHNF